MTSAPAVSRRGSLAAAAAGVLALAGCGTSSTPAAEGPAASVSFDRGGYLAGTPISDGWQLPDVTLTDTSGKPYNLRTGSTQPITLLFFGYSNCPDVCNGIIADVSTARAQLPKQARDKVRFVVITTDPARDTAAHMKTWLDRIDSSVVGLTGPLATIKTTAKAVGVDIEDGEKLPSGGYEITHGTQVIGFGKDLRAQVLWSEGTSVSNYQHDIAHLVEQAA